MKCLLSGHKTTIGGRRSPCGERGLKLSLCLKYIIPFGRSPCGERGLKYVKHSFHLKTEKSLPMRGAWIEMSLNHSFQMRAYGRSPCGERGLKYRIRHMQKSALCRSPCGERGLKFLSAGVFIPYPVSLPMRGAWIEIHKPSENVEKSVVAPHAGSVD